MNETEKTAQEILDEAFEDAEIGSLGPFPDRFMKIKVSGEKIWIKPTILCGEMISGIVQYLFSDNYEFAEEIQVNASAIIAIEGLRIWEIEKLKKQVIKGEFLTIPELTKREPRPPKPKKDYYDYSELMEVLEKQKKFKAIAERINQKTTNHDKD